MTTISPEAFMAQPSEPDEDSVVLTPPLEMAPYDPNPLDSIAQSLRQLVGHFESSAFDAGLADSVRQELLDLEEKYDRLIVLVTEIETIIKPSVSKLANEVRAAIKAWSDPEVPAAEPGAVPAHDADVEVWRAYAASQAAALELDLPDLTTMNRSQIRTALGIEQPS